MKHKIVIIEWIDSGSSDRWTGLDDITKQARSSCISCGFLVKEDKEWTVVALSYDPDSEEYQCWLEIPTVSIKKKRLVNGTRRG